MAFLNDRVLDNGLAVLNTESTHLHICSTEPVAFAGVASVSLGNKAALSVGAPAARSPNGRKVTVAAITDGNVTGNGTAAFWAITDVTNSRLLAAGPLAASQVVTTGNTFAVSAFDIGKPSP